MNNDVFAHTCPQLVKSNMLIKRDSNDSWWLVEEKNEFNGCWDDVYGKVIKCPFCGKELE